MKGVELLYLSTNDTILRMPRCTAMNIIKRHFLYHHADVWGSSVLVHFFRLVVGVVFIGISVSFLLSMPLSQMGERHTVVNSFVVTLCFFVVADMGLFVISKYPSVHRIRYLVPVGLSVFIILLLAILLFRIEYSRPVLVVAIMAAFIYLTLISYFVDGLVGVRVGLIPEGDAATLTKVKGIDWQFLDYNDEHYRCDAIAADLPTLTPEWERFISRAVLAGVPVINARKLLEALTGRVNTRHLSSGMDGSLSPSLLYMMAKRVVDIVVVLCVMPLVVPIIVMAVVIIRLESSGAAFFVQNRVGLGGREFRIYKLRSMFVDTGEADARFAAVEDSRVTDFGRFIRRTRIDELPQLFNVLKGEMSLIGPRPEQKAFVTQFEKIIPFYSYRHAVRPGITGWAQVMHGYAASADDTCLKLEYDLYYIKNFSLWLDILIGFKTIHTMLTGFGAR